MRRSGLLCAFAVLLPTGCEDGPEQIFEPNTGDPSLQNGYADNVPSFTQEGDKPFNTSGGSSDVTGQAKFCDVAVQDELIETMVLLPIIPDSGVGHIPLWTEDNLPTVIDALFGVPEYGLDGDGNTIVTNNKFCDATYVSEYYGYAYWGSDADIVVFFNPLTRLVEAEWAFGNYIGTLSGTYVEDPGGLDEREVPVTLRMGHKAIVDGAELKNYPEWVEPYATAMYKMIRETHFGDAPYGDSYNCITNQKCFIRYQDYVDNPAVAQTVVIFFTDSGVALEFQQDGTVTMIQLSGVRTAPFELGATLDFDTVAGGDINIAYTNGTCVLDFDAPLTWPEFVDDCMGGPDSPLLGRADYVTSASRDAVFIVFDNVDIGFKKPSIETPGSGDPVPLFADGQRPSDDAELYYFQVSQTAGADIPQFDAIALANDYVTRLKARLTASVAGPYCDTGDLTIPDCNVLGAAWACNMTLHRCENDHPFFGFDETTSAVLAQKDSVATEGMYIEPTAYQGLDKLVNASGQSWVPLVIKNVQAVYSGLTAEQQLQVVGLDPTINVELIHPMTEAALALFTNGVSDTAVFRQTYATDDLMWSISEAHFKVGSVPYRISTQYQVDNEAINYVTISMGTNFFDRVAGKGSPNPPYFFFADAADGGTFGLGGDGIRVIRGSADRQFETLDINVDLGNIFTPDKYTVTAVGTPYEDEGGYVRQKWGERYEWVPADVVLLYGKQNGVAYYVDPNGLIGRISQSGFNGRVPFCNGPEAVETDPTVCDDYLHPVPCTAADCFWWSGACVTTLDLDVGMGERLRDRIDAWVDAIDASGRGVGIEYYRACDIVFNYSENYNVLYSIASLNNRIHFSVENGGVTGVAAWR